MYMYSPPFLIKDFNFWISTVLIPYRSTSLCSTLEPRKDHSTAYLSQRRELRALKTIPFNIFKTILNVIEWNEDFKERFSYQWSLRVKNMNVSIFLWHNQMRNMWKNKLHRIRCGINKPGVENVNTVRQFPEMACLYCSFPSHTQHPQKKLDCTHKIYYPNHMRGLSQLIYLSVKIFLISNILRIYILVSLCMHICKATYTNYR